MCFNFIETLELGLLYYVYTLSEVLKTRWFNTFIDQTAVLSIANVVVALAAPVRSFMINYGPLLSNSHFYLRSNGVFSWNCKRVFSFNTKHTVQVDHRPLRILSSIFCTRILLNIRGTYFKPSDTSTYNDRGAKSTSFGFQSRVRPSHSHSQSTSDRRDGSTTLGTHDTVYFDETDMDILYEGQEPLPPSHGWIWSDQRPPQLTLRPMTPFGIEMTELLRPTPPSP